MKIKKIFLCFVLMMSMLCVVACKDKDKDPDKGDQPPSRSESVVHASVADRVYLVGEKLEDIEILLAMGDTNGTIVWDEEDYVLVLGENECDWTFTPADTEKYKAKTGTLTIEAKNLEKPVCTNVELVPGQTVYIEQKYADIQIQGTASFGGQPVAGTFVWKEPTRTFVSGDNICEWKFVPTDTTRYSVVDDGEPITVTASVAQEPVSIAVVENTKTQYVAYDIIDKSTLTLHLVYNGGKTERLNFGADDVTITYNNGNSLKRGDTTATITYDVYDFSAEIALEPVDYRIVQVPQFSETLVYNGQPKVLTLAENSDSDKYSFDTRTETNAGNYDIVVTLADPSNDKWSNGDETASTTVVCAILKAELVENKTNYSEEYDGEAHSASISNQTENRIFYSETALNETNFESGSAEVIEKTNAGTYTIYYFMEGDENHNHKTGTLTIEITRQAPTMNLEYCYTLETGNVVNYPTNYVSIVDKQGRPVALGELNFTYYSSYTNDNDASNDVLTTKDDDGAENTGTAPKNDKVSEYFVVVRYAGSQNYQAVEDVTVLFIDGSDLALYAKGGEDTFAFKYDENDYYGESFTAVSPQVVSASNSECNAYLEFTAKPLDDNGLKTIEFISKFGQGAEFKKSGRLVFAGGKYLLLRNDGISYTYAFNGSDEISVQLTEQASSTVVLKKWTIPKYLNTYVGKTISDEIYNADAYDKTHNTSQNTEIEIYNDYGTIRFIARINVVYSEGAHSGTANGGYQEWIGVAEFGFPECSDRVTRQALTCYITGSNSGYNKNENDFFRVVWDLDKSSGDWKIVEEPTSFTIDSSVPALESPYNNMQYLTPGNASTIVVYTKVEN